MMEHNLKDIISSQMLIIKLLNELKPNRSKFDNRGKEEMIERKILNYKSMLLDLPSIAREKVIANIVSVFQLKKIIKSNTQFLSKTVLWKVLIIIFEVYHTLQLICFKSIRQISNIDIAKLRPFLMQIENINWINKLREIYIKKPYENADRMYIENVTVILNLFVKNFSFVEQSMQEKEYN